jgi:hypothetical protein
MEEVSQLEVKVKNESLKDKTLSFIVDTAANAVFWQPFLALNETTWMGYTLEESRNARLGHLGLQIILGRYACKAIDAGRWLLNRGRYNEEKHGTERKKNFFTYLKDFAVDVAITSVYWGALMTPVLKYLNDFSWQEVGKNIALYAIPTALGAYPFGKFLDWSRKTLIPKQYGGLK